MRGVVACGDCGVEPPDLSSPIISSPRSCCISLCPITFSSLGVVLKVSVCLASFNGEAHIYEQIASILASASVDELIVSDDGSTDATRDIVMAFDDGRIMLLEGPGLGLIRNFEHALSYATGEVVFLSDQDDVWLSGKVERVLTLLNDVDMVVTDCRVVDAELREIHPSFFRLNRSNPGLWRNLAKNSYLGCCMGMRRRVVDAALPFPSDIAMHDWWLGLVAERVGRTCFIDEVWSLYRRHGGNASQTSERSTFSWLQRFRWRMQLLLPLLLLKRPRVHVQSTSLDHE